MPQGGRFGEGFGEACTVHKSRASKYFIGTELTQVPYSVTVGSFILPIQGNSAASKFFLPLWGSTLAFQDFCLPFSSKHYGVGNAYYPGSTGYLTFFLIVKANFLLIPKYIFTFQALVFKIIFLNIL